MRGVDAAEKSSVASAAPRRAADRGAPCARTRAAHHQASVDRQGRRPNSRPRSRRMGQLKTAGHAQAAGRARSTSSRPARFSPARSSSSSSRSEASDAPAVKARWAKQQAAWAASGNALAPYSFALAGGNPRRGGAPVLREPGAALRALPQGRRRRRRSRSRPLAHRRAEEARSTCSSPSSSRARTSPRVSTCVTLQLKNGATETGSVASETPTRDRAQARRRHARPPSIRSR